MNFDLEISQLDTFDEIDNVKFAIDGHLFVNQVRKFKREQISVNSDISEFNLKLNLNAINNNGSVILNTLCNNNIYTTDISV